MNTAAREMRHARTGCGLACCAGARRRSLCSRFRLDRVVWVFLPIVAHLGVVVVRILLAAALFIIAPLVVVDAHSADSLGRRLHAQPHAPPARGAIGRRSRIVVAGQIFARDA